MTLRRRVTGELSDINIGSGLLAFYPFGSSGAVDESGNGHNGVLIGSPVKIIGADGVADSAYSFNGTNQRIDIASTINLADDSSYSFSFWANIDSAATSAFMSIFSLTSTDYTKEYYTFFSNHPTYRLLYIGLNDKRRKMADDIIDYTAFKNVWTHFVITYNADTLIYSIHIDNVINSQASGSGTLVAGSISKSTIAATNNNGQYMHGGLDQIRIYDRLINNNEIQYLFANKL